MPRAAQFALAALLVFLVTAPPAAADEIADAAYRVFEQRCARCHGPDVRHPKGSFGSVLDLAKLGSERKWIVPGEPASSPLFQLVGQGTQHPNKAGEAPLDATSVVAIEAWIEAGAPPSSLFDPSRHEPAGTDPGPLTVWRFLGQFHPAVVHFPVALLMVAALAQLLALIRRSESLAGTAYFCLTLGAMGTAVATLTGWAWADVEGFGAPLHRWCGVATTCFAVATCAMAIRTQRGGTTFDHWAYHLALLATLALVVYTGHQGGALSHARLQMP